MSSALEYEIVSTESPPGSEEAALEWAGLWTVDETEHCVWEFASFPTARFFSALRSTRFAGPAYSFPVGIFERFRFGLARPCRSSGGD